MIKWKLQVYVHQMVYNTLSITMNRINAISTSRIHTHTHRHEHEITRVHHVVPLLARSPRLLQRLVRAGQNTHKKPHESFSRHTAARIARYSMLARAPCVHANGGRPAQGGSTKCCRFFNLNRSVCTQSIVRLLQPRRSSETCVKCYNFTVQETLSWAWD